MEREALTSNCWCGGDNVARARRVRFGGGVHGSRLLGSEAFAAVRQRARERPVSRVYPAVDREVILHRKPFRAVRAAEWPLPGVHPHCMPGRRPHTKRVGRTALSVTGDGAVLSLAPLVTQHAVRGAWNVVTHNMRARKWAGKGSGGSTLNPATHCVFAIAAAT